MERDGKGESGDIGARKEAQTRPLQPSTVARSTEVEPGAPPPRVTEVQGWDVGASQTPWPSSSGSDAGDDPASQSPGRYCIEALIGRGGMGEVVSARDEQIGRSVAIKRLRAPNAPADVVARFVREARIQGRLDHPAIPPVHELWRDERGQPFFVMKQLSGITLSEVLARSGAAEEAAETRDDPDGDDGAKSGARDPDTAKAGPTAKHAARDGAADPASAPASEPKPDAPRRFTRQHLLRAFVDVCLAIEFAHTRGIVHRDLKPANVMLGEFGDVYVLDWGVARVLASGAQDLAEDVAPAAPPPDLGDTVAGLVLGTPGYMSPEQARGDADLDGRADVYALGCILFEILTGEPLHASGEAGLAEAKAGVDARASRRAPDREIPPELDLVCVKATRLDRGERYATARAVGDAVQRYLDGDRDVAMRKKLAASELDIAKAALERSAAIDTAADTAAGTAIDAAIHDRRTAIRAAARALALDPSSREAAELVARLMIEPPPEVPPEVVRELAAVDEQAMRAQSRFGALALLAYFVFFPLMFWAGLRETWFMLSGSALAATTLATAMLRTRRPAMGLVYATFAGNVLIVGVLGRALTPLLLAPGTAAVIAMVYAMHPRIGRAWALWVTLAAAVLLPWLGELTGVISPTLFIGERGVSLRIAAERLDTDILTFTLALYTLAVIGAATWLSRAFARNRIAMQHSLHLQAWQLRQLVPRGGPGGESFVTMPRVTRFGTGL
ncbi:MAG TPA: serine/threonine-protein kinase [Kofleriaceae bacterium]|nr:serine/threonine-protein kinase [Kofleriaceae bacterium]